jgi:hypothetical protein
MFPSKCQHNIAMLVNIIHKYQIHIHVIAYNG